MTHSVPTFIRRQIVTLKDDQIVRTSRVLKRVEPLQRGQNPVTGFGDITALVINASTEMARPMTSELSVALPGCAILFAPTLDLALWILKRRAIDLVVTSPIFPDGPITRLHEFLEQLETPPELVVVGNLHEAPTAKEPIAGYRYVSMRRLGSGAVSANQDSPSSDDSLSNAVRALSADLRNDLNNPLQEIVAMAFVAQASAGISPLAEQALSAIERAASGMATIVNSLEDKIHGVVADNTPLVRRRRAL